MFLYPWFNVELSLRVEEGSVQLSPTLRLWIICAQFQVVYNH